MNSPAPHDVPVATVVGGGRGIGAAVVDTLARTGFRVLVADAARLRSAFNHYRTTDVGGLDAATELAEKLTAEGLDVAATEVDASDEDSAGRLTTTIGDRYGRLDLVVNAFGVTHVCAVEHMALAEFEAVVAGNLTGVFLVSKHSLPLLRADGGGAIVNFSSVSGKSGFGKVAHYCAAKAAVIGFTAALAVEEARNGVRVNAVCPGIVRSNMWEYLLTEFARPGESRDDCWARMEAMIPQRVAQEPRDVADLVRYLATARHVTGQAISVDGGMAAP